MLAPLRFKSNEDRECYRKGIRLLALMYVGILALVVIVTSVRVELRTQDAVAKSTAGAVSTAVSVLSFSSDPGRETARPRQ
jgi:hypothetical protein